VDDRELLEPDGVVGDDVRHGDGGQLGPGLHELLVLLRRELDGLTFGGNGLGPAGSFRFGIGSVFT